MATADYIISNQSGASFRTDLNNTLAAIVSNNSNSSSPSTTYAYQWWADTSAGILKIRNSANNAWIDMLNLDGTFVFDLEDGSVSAPSLRFASDTNTGLFTSGADKINFTTGGVERLELGAETVFNEDGLNVDFRIEGDSQTNLFHLDAGNDRIGIGTGSPDRHFTINASATTRMNIKSGSSSTAGIEFGDSDDFNAGFIVYDNSDNSFQFGVNGDGEKVRIASNGGLCVNSTSADNNVHIGITSSSSGIILKAAGDHHSLIDANSNRSSAGNTLHRYLGRWNGTQVAQMAFVTGSDTTNKDDGLITFATSSADNLAERVRIESSGFVGIGTSSPTNILHVNSGSTNTAAVLESTDTEVVLQLKDTTGNAFIKARNDFRFENNTAEMMRLHATGELSLATTSINLQGGGASDFYFTVLANTTSNHNGIMVSGLANNFGGFTTRPSANHLYFAGFFLNNAGSGVGNIEVGLSGTSFHTSSDYRLKENVTNISDGITRLKQLLPRRFNWIIDETNTLQDGFLAHEVSSIVPEAISGEKDAVATEDGGQFAKGDPIYQQIDHSKLVPLLVAAVKELITKVEALEAG